METARLYKADVFEEYMIKSGFSENSRRGLRNTANRFSEWAEKENIALPEMAYNDILAYINYCKQLGNKPITIRGNIGCIKHYYAMLIDEQDVTDNPCTSVAIKGIVRVKLHETFTPAELADIYRKYQEKYSQNTNQLVYKRNKVMLGLVIYQALRTEELARLVPNDIKLREGKIYIVGSRRANERELALEAHQVFDLMDYVQETRKILLAMRSHDNSSLFISMGTSERFSNMMQKLMEQLKKQDKRILDMQQLRASVITNWLKAQHIRKVQHMAGHRFISSTERYQANNMDSLKEDIGRYHPDL
jgi:site-specific recombinase XerD